MQKIVWLFLYLILMISLPRLLMDLTGIKAAFFLGILLVLVVGIVLLIVANQSSRNKKS